MWFFFLLATVGLIASAAAHFSTFAGVDPQELFPWVWVLHIGIFLVFIPAIAIQNTLRRNATGNGRGDFNDAFAGAPAWMRTLCKLLFAYMFVNFAIFAFMMRSGSPHRVNGTYVLSSHGKVSRQISEEEYHRYRGYEVRGFSGHWMGFYAFAMTMIASGMAGAAARRLDPPPESPPVPAPGAPRFLLPIWAHSAVSIVGQMIGFFTGPVLVMLTIMRLHYRPGCFVIIPFFGSAIVGVTVSGMLLERYFAARCPACGGRTYCIEDTRYRRRYRCRDCGHEDG